MPLQRSDQGVRSDGLDATYFPMETTSENGVLVGCTVSHECVQDLITRAGKTSTGDELADFEMVRGEIEQMASRKFDEGEEKPFVTCEDL
jgi:hypothetical protein